MCVCKCMCVCVCVCANKKVGKINKKKRKKRRERGINKQHYFLPYIFTVYLTLIFQPIKFSFQTFFIKKALKTSFLLQVV